MKILQGCEATVRWTAPDNGVQCGKTAVAVCLYCGMAICKEHSDGGFCTGQDCKENYWKDLNGQSLEIAWRIGESLPCPKN